MDKFEFDDDYVRRLKAGDREAEEHFYAYFRNLLLAKLSWEVRSMQAREDLTHTILARVWEKRDEIREPSKLGAFVIGFYRNVLHEEHRDQDRRLEPLPDGYDPPADDNPFADRVKQEEKEQIRRMLQSLKKRDRDILEDLLRDLDKDEICRTYGIDRKYLRVLLHRAIQRLRELFGPKDDPPPDPPKPPRKDHL